jgi:hypothetical protein
MKAVTALSVSFPELGVFRSSLAIEPPAKRKIENNSFSLEIPGKGLARFSLENRDCLREYNTSYPFSPSPDLEDLKNFLDWLDSNWPETRVYFTGNLVNSEGELNGEVLVYVDPSDFDDLGNQYPDKDVPIENVLDPGNSSGTSSAEYITQIVESLLRDGIEIPAEIAARIEQRGIEIPSEIAEPAEDCLLDRD